MNLLLTSTPRVARAQPWAGICERFQRFKPGGSAPWLSFDCDTGETQKGYWWKTECGGRQVEDKSIIAVGTVNFSIKFRNELAGNNTTLFSGRMKVARTLSNEHGPKAVNKFVYYVDHDWNLPIGYVWYTPDSVYAWDYSQFNIGFWVRGEAYKLDPHLFYKGQEVGRMFMDDRWGRAVYTRSSYSPTQQSVPADLRRG